ncbi:YoaK family protein [Paraglaciecola sp.]|uniref:YoaK family protein n=1 Tax=Paraglaciecola sp. TaxID=1920173 RepID=UPI0030F40A17
MIKRLPRWIEYGAFILAFSAGCINAIGLLGLSHQAISHLSGTATLIGSAFANADSASLSNYILILVSFLVGAALSGLLLSGRSVKSGRQYDSLLVIEGILLVLAMLLLNQGSFYGHYLASCACGIQNALATTYSGAIVRTTHVTGIFTDLGIMLGAKFRGEKLDQRKAILFVLIIMGFIAGGVLGSVLFRHFAFLALIAPVIICLLLALTYRIFIKNSPIPNSRPH